MRAEVARAADSHGGLVLVTGEAGIGKTTLVAGAADEARRHGALVLAGACWDSGSAPGYWPWVQVLRALRRTATPEEWSAAEQAGGDGLAVLLGEAPRQDTSDSFALHDAVTSALVSVSQSRPVVVVLDDLHWADTASLRLLEFAARHTWFERLLLIGAYRDVEVEDTGHALGPLILSLVAKATTVTLTGLDRDDIAALMARTVGHEPDPELVAEVHRRTGGNPFFVEQTARLWHSGGSVTAIAPGVRDAVRHRLSLLPAPVAQLLTAASVLGSEFHRQVLAAAVAAPVAQVDRLLDRAIAARLVTAKGGGVFAFAHDLVRESLHESLDDTQLRARHAAIVTAMRRSPALAERLFPGDLARHAFLAGDEVELGHRIDLLLAAGRSAASRMAFDEAVGHFRRGLELAGPAEAHRRITLVGELCSELAHAGDTEEAWRLLDEAAAFCREHADPALLARVALTGYRLGHHTGHPAREPLLREAHARLVRDEPAERDTPIEQLATELAIQLEQLARRGGDDEALGFILWTIHDTIWGPGTAERRLALTDELAAVGRRTGDLEMEQYAASLRWVALLERGDPGYLAQLDTFVTLADQGVDTRMKLGATVDECIIAGFTGRFAEADALFAKVLATLEDSEHVHFASMLYHMRWQHLYAQGRLDEVEQLYPSLSETDHGRLRVVQAITALATGDPAPALRYLAETPDAAQRFSIRTRPLWLRFLAQTAAVSRDPELCERARAELAPYRGQYLVSMFGFDLGGPVLYWLARLDAAQQRWDSAVEGFTEAARSADAMRARPWAVEARSGLADALLARGGPGDDDRAAGLLREVQREADTLGLRHLASPAPASPASDVDATDREPAGEFRFTGGTWRLSLNGETVHMPDAKGLRDLHTLLSRPGADIPAVSLLDPAGGELVVAARRLGGDDVLDEEARSRYKRRLTELDEQIDAATERGADDRAAQLDRERAALLHELRAAAGLGGRPRRLGDEAERARKTVTARIRDTLRKLDDRHPQLSAHLRATVSTGTHCRYDPDGTVSWRLS
ncbi:ATPase [Prauserella muralis]|uniref:ATPase n=1 Tax=Prauserella muralis TaxID=588067 RepID=A0A2V4AI90_9PSEU|nr:ATPase [Prauserella muralis]